MPKRIKEHKLDSADSPKTKRQSKYRDKHPEIAEKSNAKLGGYSLSPEQKEFQNIIRESNLVFCRGYAGVGKTLACLHYFVQEYLNDTSKQIIIIRTPCESADKDKIGYLPSDLNSKIEPHFVSTRLLLNDLLGKGKVDADINSGRIKFMVPNFMLGATFDNSLIMVDEAQQISPLTMKLILERLGTDTVCVVLGDDSQVYASDSNRNGLKSAIEKFFVPVPVPVETMPKSMQLAMGLVDTSEEGVVKQEYTRRFPSWTDINYYRFSISSIQRSELCKKVVTAYST